MKLLLIQKIIFLKVIKINKFKTGGSSIDPCSDTHAGKSAGSELETAALINAITAKKGSWAAYISIHSYGNWWLLPYGNSYTVRPTNYNDMMDKGRIGAAAIKAYKSKILTLKMK